MADRFGAHVAVRACQCALRQSGAGIDQASQTEVGHFGTFMIVEQDVLRLEVTMADAGTMRGFHAAHSLLPSRAKA
jgi:hypothetical protein